MAFTDVAIRNLKCPPPPERMEVFDGDIPGFGLRVSHSGRKTFFLVYRVGRRSGRLTLGQYPIITLAEARQKAKEALSEILHGRDPGVAKRADRQADTFGELFAEYLADPRVSQKRSFKEDQRIGRKELLPALGNLRLKEIDISHIERVLRKITRRGAGVMANRTLALARSVFNFANRKRIYVGMNPCNGVSRPAKESPRERVYTDAEVRAIWKACESESKWVGAALRLYFLTAARRSEILWMRWSEIDLKAGTWTLPGPRTKNGRMHLVPLATLAVEILTELRRGSETEFVFPGRKGNKPVTSIQRRRLEAIGSAAGVSVVRLHDIRRTAATGLAKRGVSRFIVGKVLNHVDGGVTSIYDTHEYASERRAALEAWAQDLVRIVTQQDAA